MLRIKYIFLFITLSLYSKEIVIDLVEQTLVAKDDDRIYLASKISSGAIGYETPKGTFYVFEKKEAHRSNLYPISSDGKRGGAEMPFMLKFKETGEAIHAGVLPGFPDSHGCVRVPLKEASILYFWADIGTKVTILGDAVQKYVHIPKSQYSELSSHIETIGASVFAQKGITSKAFYDKALELDY
ncbi:MAG TPA: L,D-transpeptidase [Epsilonproteobacteria bacterium]|nr:L,D-transpeptidase [Campylobacterota bacterium]